MRFIIPFILVSCSNTQPSAPSPATPASSHDCPAVSAPTASAEPPQPAPTASATASAAPTPPEAPKWGQVASEDWGKVLLGRWVGVEKGDAIPAGPTGGKMVEGGIRLDITKRADSKTPFNLLFWAPAEGHMTASVVSGGCGFYPSGTAFCKGYGLDGDKATKTTLFFEITQECETAYCHLRVTINGMATLEVVKKK